MKWSHRELHDTLLVAGLSVPTVPSLINYFSVLYAQFGDAQAGFMPQAFVTHTKDKIQQILKCLSRTGLKLGGRLADPKGVLVERLAHWLNQVVEAGRDVSLSDTTGDDESDGALAEPRRPRRMSVLPQTRQLGEVPFDAIVTPEQAESALGRVQATEIDEELLEMLDLELRCEEEELAGRRINPTNVDYTCLCASASEACEADIYGWNAAGMPPRQLGRADFVFTSGDMQMRLAQGVQALYSQVEEDVLAGGEVLLTTLDPTQLVAFQLVDEWAMQRHLWRIGRSLTAPPLLRMILLGTAGTGKTHTAKLTISKARRTFGSFHSVLTVAYSGVAASNLGDGARTVDSIFHTNTEDAANDLAGEALDKLVETLCHVQLLVIDEVSTLGAPAFEIMSRRFEQVGKVLWRNRTGCKPPDSLGGFGGIGVLLIGDFAQLPPVNSSSLLPDGAIEEKRSSGARSLTLAGRQNFSDFRASCSPAQGAPFNWHRSFQRIHFAVAGCCVHLGGLFLVEIPRTEQP